MPRVSRRILVANSRNTAFVVDRLEMVDVDKQHRKRLAALRGILEQRGEMAGHIAAIMQPGERVENCHLDALLEPHQQMVEIALALDLGAHPRQQLVRVDRAHHVVVDPHVQASEQGPIVTRLGDDQDRQVACPVERADLRT